MYIYTYYFVELYHDKTKEQNKKKNGTCLGHKSVCREENCDYKKGRTVHHITIMRFCIC
jgi:hypothetical protein